MSNSTQRYGGRAFNSLRKVRAIFGAFGYAPGSVLFEMGRTKVLCAVSMQPGVPSFLKGKKRGWLTAEYSMLPTSTSIRTQRDTSTMRRNGRSVEISRLIGRALRMIIDFDILGERTIYVDCDVLQADAGTRTACITGAAMALRVAVKKWLNDGIIAQTILTGDVAAVSVGVLNGIPLLDLDFSEDSNVDADFNVVMTKAGQMVEFQGSAEGASLSWEQFEQVRILAVSGIQQLFNICDAEFKKQQEKTVQSQKTSTQSLFSLQNRQQLSS